MSPKLNIDNQIKINSSILAQKMEEPEQIELFDREKFIVGDKPMRNSLKKLKSSADSIKSKKTAPKET